MIALLEKLLIKNRDNINDPKVRESYGILCGSVGILLNILLFSGKFFAGGISNSIAITADAFNNLSDAASSLVTLLGFKLSGKKPDLDHPFGHGRIEYLSGLIVSGAIIVMAYELVKSSITKIIHPTAVDFSVLSVFILIASILVKLYMTYYNRRIAKKLNSAAMSATAIDSLSDSLATSAVLLATIFAKLTGIQIDGYCGVLVGLFILYSGINAAKETISPLLGTPPDDEFVDKIRQIVLSYDGVIGIHDLIVHDYGPGRVILSLHAEVPASGDILVMHDMIDNIETRLHTELNAVAVIHMDPIVTDDDEVNKLNEMTRSIVNAIDETLSIHDFRIVRGPTHTNLLFDVAAPFQCQTSDDELKEQICKEICKNSNTYFSIIQIDRTSIK